jgi:hypothetical protein
LLSSLFCCQKVFFAANLLINIIIIIIIIYKFILGCEGENNVWKYGKWRWK